MNKGELTKVENFKRRFGSQREYWAIHCDEQGEPVTILLTEHQLAEAKKRARDNPEDIPKREKLRFFSRLNVLFTG